MYRSYLHILCILHLFIGNIGFSEEETTLDATWKTRTEARALTLDIPAPRGQIVDHRGYPLAHSEVAYRVAFQFPFFKEASDEKIIKYAQERLKKANQKFNKTWTLREKHILDHYKNRRWLPLLLPRSIINQELPSEENLKNDGLQLFPVYRRYYPEKSTASHILGHVGLVRRLSKGPIDIGEPLFEETMGREGIEKAFNDKLVGKPGEINILFDTDGTKLSEELTKQPKPGNNIVTTLNRDFQVYAKTALRKSVKSGAAVLLNAQNGDILAMASEPSFQPGKFSEGISTADYKEILEDPLKPLFPRAFTGAYPPASTFKIIVGMAALEAGVISPWSEFDCPPHIWIGNRKFKNWNKKHEGTLDIHGAIRRSCNTWFYKVGIKTGSDNIASMASRLGFGESLGLPIPGGIRGNIPDHAQSIRKRGHKLSHGDVANISIGQSTVSASPLQVARAMAAVGTGYFVPELRLVKQIQDVNQNVIEYFPPAQPKSLNVESRTLKAVQRGMHEVVHAGNGTGKGASISSAVVAGKTGTAQWLTSEKRNLAWFAGYVPADNPQFAFAVLYEGSKGENVSGGGKAAPIVREILEKVYSDLANNPALRKEFANTEQYKEAVSGTPEIESDPPKAIGIDSFDEDKPEKPVPSAMPMPEINQPAPVQQKPITQNQPQAQPVPQEKPKKKGIFRRIFGR